MAGKEKQFDAFLSYSHTDKKSIVEIAETLKQRRIRVWYAGWEMKPGDVLRERINQGIEQAAYFLVVLSENSLASSWVKFELNSAMIREIEERHVRVIPSIIGTIDFSDLPLDLRVKYCLDFRNEESFNQSIDALTDLIQPERRLRKQLLARLRTPDRGSLSTISELREYAVRYGDQALQVAAIQGLEKIGGRDAIMALTERVLDSWGLRGIGRAIKALSRLPEHGGLLPLTASLFYDYRFFDDKLLALVNAARRMRMPEVANKIQKIYDRNGKKYPPSAAYNVRDALPRILSKLELVPFDDIKYGAIIARRVNPPPSRSNKIDLPEEKKMEHAMTYAEKRLPGLLNLLKNNPSKMWDFLQ